MSKQIEVCPNPKCPYRDNKDNPDKKAFQRDFIKVSDHLCSWCESRLVEA